MAELCGLEGGDWTRNLFVYDDENPHIPREFKQDDLVQLANRLGNVKIEEIFVYKYPLFDWQKSDDLIYHMFRVFKADKWWWSIEKIMKGIILQHKNIESKVRYYREGENRHPGPIEEIIAAKGKHTISELIEWLHDKKELDRTYNVLSDNCQDFGSRVYHYMTGHILKYPIVGS